MVIEPLLYPFKLFNNPIIKSALDVKVNEFKYGYLKLCCTTCNSKRKSLGDYYTYYLPRRNEITLCDIHMKEIFTFTENEIIKLYEKLFNKYILFGDFNLDIDSINYIFKLIL